MKISETTIGEFRQAVKEDYGRDLGPAEASEILYTLVGYFDLLAKIHHREKTNNNDNYNYDKQSNN